MLLLLTVSLAGVDGGTGVGAVRLDGGCGEEDFCEFCSSGGEEDLCSEVGEWCSGEWCSVEWRSGKWSPGDEELGWGEEEWCCDRIEWCRGWYFDVDWC